MDKLGVLWFAAASLVVAWDALFVLLRPSTLPGGDLHHLFKPYELYIQIDKRYGDMSDTFGYAQAWANVIEIVLNLATLTLLLQKNRGAYLCGFLVSTMTFWKTVIYMMQYFDFCGGGDVIKHVEWPHYLGLFVLPNGIWIIVPFYIMISYGKILCAGLNCMDLQKLKLE